MKNSKKILNVLQNATFDTGTVRFIRVGEYCYEVRYMYELAGRIKWDKQSRYWIYSPLKLLPRAPGLHAPQIVNKLNDLKKHLQSLV